jgi:hypothetical protein
MDGAPRQHAVSIPAQAGLAIGQVRGLKLKWAYGFTGDVTATPLPPF